MGFEKLLEPGYIGPVRTRNRMIKTAAGTSFVEKGGYIGETIKGFYEALAKGGVGLVTVESCGVEYPLGTHHLPVQLHLEDDKYIPSYSELTEVIHKYNCPAFIQLMHSGPWHPSSATGLTPVSSSSLSKNRLSELNIEKLRGLTIPEIEELVNKYVQAAKRAQKAGFDGIEINANSSILIDTFLSCVWNERQDAYGCQSLENRARFLVEIIRETKKQVGEDFPVSVLLTGAEYGNEKGITSGEAQGFARLIQKAGADAIQVRAWGYGDYRILHPGPERILYPERPKSLVRGLDWSKNGVGAFVPLAEAVKSVVSIPVIAVGRLDPQTGEKILKQGKADFIGLNRRLLADPELPNKVAKGNLKDIAPCTACYYCWHERLNDRPIRCRINTSLGREREYTLKPVEKKKRVMVIGGGPAGMEAARVAALRGHQVFLYEKGSKLGGLLLLAGLIKGFEIEDLMCAVDYLKHQIANLGVTIRLRTEVNLAVIQNLKPDVVILATGGVDVLPDIPGINNRKVIHGSVLHNQLKTFLRFLDPKSLRALTRIWMPLGKNCVIIGGGIQGCQLAEFLASRQRKVTIVETTDTIGEGLIPLDTRRRLLNWLQEKEVTILSGIKLEEITNQGLHIITPENERKILFADNIIPALPQQPGHQLFKIVEQAVPEIYAVGDCREPHLSAEAIADGARVGYRI